MSPSNQATTGAGAKDAVRKYFRASVHPASGPFLQWLDMQGYIIVPKAYQAPVRRGNAEPLIGRSHTDAIIKGRSE